MIGDGDPCGERSTDGGLYWSSLLIEEAKIHQFRCWTKPGREERPNPRKIWTVLLSFDFCLLIFLNSGAKSLQREVDELRYWKYTTVVLYVVAQHET